jgi:protein-tyrosine phosphatase
MTGGPYRILMVCTGNICRSPVMERLLAARLRTSVGPAAAARFEIGSAGTWAMDAAPIQPEAAATLEALGGDPGGFVSRDLTPELIESADLVLAATREHRGAVVSMSPRAAARTVTLRELARLLGPVTVADIDAVVTSGDVVERMRAVVAAAFANRGLVPLAEAAGDDVADPYRRDRAAYERSAAAIDAALAVPVALLIPAAG